jgi:disulfide bond formation protein DsbB
VIKTRWQHLLRSKFLLIGLAGAGSAGLLLAALGFQFLGGLAPCALCIWQRWPHLVAVVLAPFALRAKGAALPLIGAASAAASGVVGVFHTGVERDWWEGLTSCAGNLNLNGLSAEEALNAIMVAVPVRCDEVAWSFIGLSMASWNAVISFALAALWMRAAMATLDKGKPGH